MPRIPIYQFKTNIQGTAGSTAVPIISQQSTSGQIAAQADTLSKSLQTVSKFADAIIDNEAKRIVSSESVKYQGMLNDLQKSIQLNSYNTPETWLQQFDEGKQKIISEINSKDYKYDFIGNQVLNQFAVDSLPLRNGLFDGYLKRTKTLTLASTQEDLYIRGSTLGEKVNLSALDFGAELTQLAEQMNLYGMSGASDSELVSAKNQVFTNAFLSGLDEYTAGLTDLQKSALKIQDLDNENLQTILSFLEPDDALATLEKWTDDAWEDYSRQEKLNENALKKLEDKRDDVVDLIHKANNIEDAQAALDIYDTLPDSITSLDERTILENYITASFDENGTKQQVLSLVDDEIKESQLKQKILDDDLTYNELVAQLPFLSLAQQDKILTFYKNNKNEKDTTVIKKIKTMFGQNDVIDINLGVEDSLGDKILDQAVSYALDEYYRIKLEQGVKFDPIAALAQVEQLTKTTFKKNIETAIQDIIINLSTGENAVDFVTTKVKPSELEQVLQDYTNANLSSDDELLRTQAFVAFGVLKDNAILFKMLKTYSEQ